MNLGKSPQAIQKPELWAFLMMGHHPPCPDLNKGQFVDIFWLFLSSPIWRQCHLHQLFYSFIFLKQGTLPFLRNTHRLTTSENQGHAHFGIRNLKMVNWWILNLYRNQQSPFCPRQPPPKKKHRKKKILEVFSKFAPCFPKTKSVP